MQYQLTDHFLPAALLAIPYGLLADRRGRKPTLCLAIPGFAIHTIIILTVTWFSDIFPYARSGCRAWPGWSGVVRLWRLPLSGP